ncbi:MAG: Asp23/Gls24 family envelope stress response protein [Clostridiales Family XIII bacterium]|jgi:uncharacterized alkaline shock family protein YloU|nr:Asp23/Gls24 family envelope stress response protein [Clostridiales Family XIII bacterium]
MEVYSLVGKSGTGKSFQANELCNEHGIESIIDDGLFIVRGDILAGHSAKRQSTKIRAIKTALFTDGQHRHNVAQAIRVAAPSSVLVIGTSDKMIGIITTRLGLPAPGTRFAIEELTTEKERELARKHREEMGQHVIPAPTFQIKKDFSGYFVHPLRHIKGITQDLKVGLRPTGVARAKPARGYVFSERSIVRPTYSYLGGFAISDKAIADVARLATEGVAGIASIPVVFVSNHEGGASVDMGIVFRGGTQVLDASRRLQERVAERIEEITSINILSVNIEIRGLEWQKG